MQKTAHKIAPEEDRADPQAELALCRHNPVGGSQETTHRGETVEEQIEPERGEEADLAEEDMALLEHATTLLRIAGHRPARDVDSQVGEGRPGVHCRTLYRASGTALAFTGNTPSVSVSSPRRHRAAG